MKLSLVFALDQFADKVLLESDVEMAALYDKKLQKHTLDGVIDMLFFMVHRDFIINSE